VQGIVMVQAPIPSLPLFWIFSLDAVMQLFQHIHKTTDFLFVVEEQTPCALSQQHQKKKSTLS